MDVAKECIHRRDFKISGSEEEKRSWKFFFQKNWVLALWVWIRIDWLFLSKGFKGKRLNAFTTIPL